MNTSPLLIAEHPLQVLPSLAVKIGLNEAIVLQQVHYWLVHNERSNSQYHYHDGRWWTYNSIREWQEKNFPFWTEKTIRSAFKSLEARGLILCGNFNRDNRDRTKWYTIDYDTLNAEGENAFGNFYRMQEVTSTESIGSDLPNDLYTETNYSETISQRLATTSQGEGSGVKRENEADQEMENAQDVAASVQACLKESQVDVAKSRTLIQACKGKPVDVARLNAIAVLEKVRAGKVKSPQGMLITALRENWAPSWDFVSRGEFSDYARKIWIQESLKAASACGIFKDLGIVRVTLGDENYECELASGTIRTLEYTFAPFLDHDLNTLWARLHCDMEMAS